jgi:AraC-like DNA-binding protein
MRAPSPGGPCKCLAAGGRPAHIPRVTGPRHDSAVTDGSLRFGELAPHPRLGGLVERHWTLEVRTTPAAVRVRPDALVDLVFDLGEPVTAWIAGPRLSPIEYTHTRLTRLLGVSLRAPGALAVLGAPAGALTPEWQPLSDVLGPVAEALSEALGREPTLEGRIGLLEVFLGARLAAAPVDAWVASAVGETISADGLLEISRSARRAGTSSHNLTRFFRAWLAVGPRRYARIVRAEAARRRMADGADPGALAAELGFADPEELERELHAFTGGLAQALAARLHGLDDAAEP